MGIRINDYNEMTPYQLNLHVIEYNQRKMEEQKNEEAISEEKLRMIYLNALWTSRFIWQKRIPSYEELTKKKTSKKHMTAEEMFEQVKKLNALFGGTVSKEEAK